MAAVTINGCSHKWMLLTGAMAGVTASVHGRSGGVRRRTVSQGPSDAENMPFAVSDIGNGAN
jgi:hypothetical protein